MDQESLNILFMLVCVPFALVTFAVLVGSRFRQLVSHLTHRQENRSDASPPTVEESFDRAPAHSTLLPLVLRRLVSTEVAPATGEVADALFEADSTARAGNLAYAAAGLVYMAVLTFALTLGMPTLYRKWHPYAQLILVYLQQVPAIFFVVWFLRIPLRARLVVFGGYLLLGLPVMLFAPSFDRAARVAGLLWQLAVLWPIAGPLLLLSRPLRPWLLGIVAVLLFLLMEMVTAVLLGIDRLDLKAELSGFSPGLWVEAAMVLIGAVVFVGWLLPRPRWRRPLGGLAGLAAAGLVLDWLLPRYKLGPASIGMLSVGLFANVLQVLGVWSFFKLLVRLQERQFLPAQTLHSHLCLGFLTAYTWTLALYAYQPWTSWVVLLAYALYLAILHSLLRRLWAARVGRPGKRLLLLRVFGRADRRGRLLDSLEDTWCRIGRIDLIAGTDLAMRTLGSRMLEAFLLRRTDEQFLKTEKDVDRRLENLCSHLQGDARYPINPVYCYSSAWQEAVRRLAPKSDVVLMDLRCFTRQNRGCAFELGWVVQHLPLSRFVLLTNAKSDEQAIEEIARLAWTTGPPVSPIFTLTSGF